MTGSLFNGYRFRQGPAEGLLFFPVLPDDACHCRSLPDNVMSCKSNRHGFRAPGADDRYSANIGSQ